MEIGAFSYVGAFAVSLALALGLTPLALRLAVSKEVLDRPGDYKVQESPVPYLGGVAIVISFAIAVLIATLINPPDSRLGELVILLGCAVGLSIMGLIDDLRGLPPLLRLAVQIGAALAIWSTGVGVHLFDNDIPNAVLTVFWIVGVTNAFNLLDNMDGLSAGTASIASGFFFILAALNGQLLVAALSIALCGCALGFLRHNVHPARIYMGDAGSLFLGFMLSVLGVKLHFDAPASVTFMVPILVLGVAIFDTTLVVTSRVLNKRGVLTGGRDHISHRLVFVGIPVRAAVALVYGAGITLGWLAIVMSRQDRSTGFILMGLVISLAVFAGTLLGSVPVYATSKRKKLMITEVSPHEEPGDVDEDAEETPITA